jgi:hypothetical protein
MATNYPTLKGLSRGGKIAITDKQFAAAQGAVLHEAMKDDQPGAMDRRRAKRLARKAVHPQKSAKKSR